MQWAKSELNFDFRDWQRFPIIFKINWICNCVKHRDGFPVKEPKPLFFYDVDESKRLRITPAEFKQDCEILLEFYPVYVQSVFAFASLKYAWDTSSPANTTDFPALQYFYVKQREELRIKTIEIVNKLENLRLYST